MQFTTRIMRRRVGYVFLLSNAFRQRLLATSVSVLTAMELAFQNCLLCQRLGKLTLSCRKSFGRFWCVINF